MKKMLFSVVTVVTILLAGSCQKEDFGSEAGNVVAYTVQLPGSLATKAAIGEDVSSVTELVYAVYRSEASEADDYLSAETCLYRKTATLTNGQATLYLELVNNQNFRVLFWAQDPDADIYDATDLKNVTIDYSGLDANQESYAAFAGSDFIKSGDVLTGRTVYLHRAVAQLNIATTPESMVLGEAGAGETSSMVTNVTLTSSQVTVNGLASSYNIADASVGNIITDDFVFDATDPALLSEQTLNVRNLGYRYISMNYVAFAPALGTNVEVDYTIVTNVGTITNEVSNVPVKPNYRTNIIGNLITSTSDYTVILDNEWPDDGKENMEIVTDGLVLNVNGDYEVTSSTGLAYAANNLFANGGNFYLTEELYDLSGYAVNPPSVPAGVVLNIYGETPVVTRAAVTLAGVTITGLDSLVGEIHGSVFISGINMADAGAVLVEKVASDATLVVSDCTASAIVGEGTVVDAGEVSTFAQLQAAVNSGVEEVTLVSDIEASDVLFIEKSVVINGSGFALSSSATRVARVKTSDLEVVINDLDMVSNAVRVGESDIRGISFDTSLNNVSLTLNDCSVDFTDASASDWAYAVNLSGSTGNCHLVINGGSYEGANVINVWGNNHDIVIDGATLTSLYLPNDLFAGADIRLENSGVSLVVRNSTFNGGHAYPVTQGTSASDNVLDVDDSNVDNTSLYGAEEVVPGLKKVPARNVYYVSTADGLAHFNTMCEDQSAGKAAELIFCKDIDFAGKTWTAVDSHADKAFYLSKIDGDGHTLSNFTVSGQAMFTRFAGSGNVEIKNLIFDNAAVTTSKINTAILVGHTYQNVLLDNVDVKNSHITGGYKVAPLIGTVYNESSSTIVATLRDCDVENTVVKAVSYDFCTTGMVAFVYAEDNDRIEFENCSVKDVLLYAPNVYSAHAAVYTTSSEDCFNEVEGVTVSNVTFENI